MLTDIVSCQCPDCHKEMELISQPRFNGGSLTLATCKNPQCPLFRTTLTPDDWATKSATEFEAYREANRLNKWLCRVVVVSRD